MKYKNWIWEDHDEMGKHLICKKCGCKVVTGRHDEWTPDECPNCGEFKIENPLENGFCEKCECFIEDHFCEAYTFASHLADCFFIPGCEMYKEREE